MSATPVALAVGGPSALAGGGNTIAVGYDAAVALGVSADALTGLGNDSYVISSSKTGVPKGSYVSPHAISTRNLPLPCDLQSSFLTDRLCDARSSLGAKPRSAAPDSRSTISSASSGVSSSRSTTRVRLTRNPTSLLNDAVFADRFCDFVVSASGGGMPDGSQRPADNRSVQSSHTFLAFLAFFYHFAHLSCVLCSTYHPLYEYRDNNEWAAATHSPWAAKLGYNGVNTQATCSPS